VAKQGETNCAADSTGTNSANGTYLLDTLKQLDQKNDMANGLTTATAKLPTVTKAVPASQLPGVSKLPLRKPSGHTTNINKRRQVEHCAWVLVCWQQQ
jgi:hypothetical protein